MPYTEEQKAEAVRLYLEVGPDEAAEIMGCSRRSIYGWLGLHNVQLIKSDERRAATYDRIATKREEIRLLLAEQAADMLHRQNEMHVEYREVDGKPEQVIHLKAAPRDCKDYATAAAIMIDKLRLELGESTGKTETVTLTAGLLEAEIQRLESELGKRAPANP